MNAGVVGVGPWGRTLAEAFRRAGTDIVAHSRGGSGEPVPAMGRSLPWPDLISRRDVDVVACAVGPEVNTAVFRACQLARKPCFVSKPLLLGDDSLADISAPAYVDYVHLASPLYARLRKRATLDYATNAVVVEFWGRGPARRFPGAWDYGAHAFAALRDLLGLGPLREPKTSSVSPDSLEGPGYEWISVTSDIDDVRVSASVGNAASSTRRCIRAYLERGPILTYEESNGRAKLWDGNKILAEMPDHDPLGILVSHFLADVEAGRCDPRFVNLSRAVARDLEAVRPWRRLP